MPNFINIAQTAVKVSQLLDFSKWRLPLSWILIFLKYLTVGHVKKVEPLHCAKFRLNRSNPGWHMVIFIIQDGGCRHLWFLKFKIFNDRNSEEGQTMSQCQILLKSLKTRPRYVSFNIMLVWLENAYSCPFWGVFWGTFPQMMSLIDLTPTRTILGQNHVISVCALTSVVVKIVEDKWPHTPRSVGGVSISLLQASYPIGGYTAVWDLRLPSQLHISASCPLARTHFLLHRG